MFTPRKETVEQQRLNPLQYNIKLEMRQLKRQDQGDTYNPICLSDNDCDDKWIPEQEDPRLPQDYS